MQLLWKGYRFIYLPKNVPSLSNAITEMWEHSKRELCLALEVYQCFYNEYKEYILYLLSKKKLFSTNVTSKIGLILIQFAIEDYTEDYYANLNVQIDSLDKDKIKYDDLNLKLWDNMSNPPCPTCYFGGGYYQYLLEDKENKIKDEEYIKYNEINTKDRYVVMLVDKKFKNRHRKQKYRQKKRRKMKERSKKKRRNDLLLYTKQIHKSLFVNQI
eukprot:334206_1